MILTLNVPVQSQTGGYFSYVNSFYGAQSKWIVTVMVDMDVYASHLGQARTAIQGLEVIVNNFINIESVHENNTADWISNLLHHSQILVARQQRQLSLEYKKIEDIYDGIERLTIRLDRDKRALLPFLAPLFSGLFGVASEASVRDMHSRIRGLAEGQKDIITVLDQSLTIINKTHEVARKNRNHLNKLTTSVNGLQSQVGRLYELIASDIQPAINFLSLQTDIHDLYHLISSTLRDLHMSITSLSQQLVDAIQGTISTALISPSSLTNLLKGIQKDLPPGYILPFNIKRLGILSFYKLLHPLIFPGKSKFLIVIEVPVAVNNQQFELYQTHALPVPDTASNNSMTYNMDAKYIALARDKTGYIAFPDSVNNCDNLPLCRPPGPVKPVEGSTSCALALLVKDATMISTNCIKIITPSKPYPIVEYLNTDVWALSSTFPFKLQITCIKPEDSEQIQASFGIQTLTLGSGCSATSKYFFLPPSSLGKHDIMKKSKTLESIQLLNLLPSIWKIRSMLPTILPIPQQPDALSTLSPLSPLNVQNLTDIMHRRLIKLSTNIKHPIGIWYVVSLIIIILFGCVIVSFLLYKFFLFRKARALVHTRHREPDPEIPVEENPTHPSTSRLSPSGSLVSLKRFAGPAECEPEAKRKRTVVKIS